jgi:hypothetical protein
LLNVTVSGAFPCNGSAENPAYGTPAGVAVSGTRVFDAVADAVTVAVLVGDGERVDVREGMFVAVSVEVASTVGEAVSVTTWAASSAGSCRAE